MSKVRKVASPIRKALENHGPEHIPEEFRKSLPEHELGWLTYDANSPYRMETRLNYGWEPILKTELESAVSLMKKYSIGSSEVTTQGSYVTKVGRDGVVKYLMKIPKDKWQEVLEHRHGLADEREETMQSTMEKISGGEAGFEKTAPNTQHVFTAFK